MSKRAFDYLATSSMCAFAVACGLWATPVFAQDGAEQDSGSLAEIVVTARRTAENNQDVPQTVSVLSADALADKGADQISNIGGLVSNLVWVDGGGGTLTNRITLRGIFSNASSQGFDPGIAVYVDEVYVGNQFGFNAALLDIDRIEVLKGPQGTLFGRNSAAGAIAVHTKRPSIDEFSGVADIRAGNYDLRQGRALINVPLSPDAALKISGIYRQRDGYQRNALDGQRDLNDEKFFGGKAQLLFRPTERLELVATAEYFKNDDHQDIRTCVQAPGKLPCPNPTLASLEDDIAADNDSTTRRVSFGTSLAANWEVSDDADIASITAFRDLDVRQDQDQDYSTRDLVRSGTIVPKDWQFSQELRLTTNQDKRIRGVVGLYYFKEDRQTNIPLEFTAELLNEAFGAGLTSSVIQVTNSRLKTSSAAIFGQAQFDILENVTLEGGIRYTRDRKAFEYSQTLTPNAATMPPFIAPILGLAAVASDSGSARFSKLTYTASLSWQPADDILAYARYATGFKSGGYAAATFSPNYDPTVPFGPENSGQFEAGLKTELLDNRVRFNVAAFRTSYRDTQVQLIDPVTLSKTIGNFGSARAEGLEFELSALLASGLTFDANLGLQRSRFKSGLFTGRSFQYVPSTTASGSLSYEGAISSRWQVVANATIAYRSAMNMNTSATTSPDFFRSAGVTTVNGRFGFEQDGTGFSVYLFANNLTDKRRVTFFQPASVLSNPTYQLSSPRTFGVEAKIVF